MNQFISVLLLIPYCWQKQLINIWSSILFQFKLYLTNQFITAEWFSYSFKSVNVFGSLHFFLKTSFKSNHSLILLQFSRVTMCPCLNCFFFFFTDNEGWNDKEQCFISSFRGYRSLRGLFRAIASLISRCTSLRAVMVKITQVHKFKQPLRINDNRKRWNEGRKKKTVN